MPLRVAIAHAQAPEQAAALASAIARVRPLAAIELLVPLGPVVGTYGGPGTIGLLWVAEPAVAEPATVGVMLSGCARCCARSPRDADS